MIVAITSVISLILPTASSNISAFIYFIAASFLSATALMGRFCISHNSYYRAQKKVTPTGPVEHVSVGRVVSESARYAFCVGYLFVVTIMVFPSITSLVKPVKPTIDGNLFVAFHFLIFNIGDWMGRTLPLYKMFVTTNINRIVLLSIARTAFIPLFLICHVVPRAHGATFINNDVLFLVLCWMFALTNGWLCSLVMMAAPQAPGIREEERAMVGSIMSFTLVLGLAMGGSLSFVTRLMV